MVNNIGAYMTTEDYDIVEIISDDEEVSDNNYLPTFEGSSSVHNQYQKNNNINFISRPSGGNDETHNEVDYSNISNDSISYLKRRKLFGSTRLDSLTRSFNSTSFPNAHQISNMTRHDDEEQNNNLDINVQEYINGIPKSSSENIGPNKSGILDSAVEIISISSDDDVEINDITARGEIDKIRYNNRTSSDSDDDLLILDADEATRTRTFKETSFERNQRRFPRINLHSSNISHMDNNKINNFNKPVPTKDISTQENYVDVLNDEINSRLEIYEKDRSDYISRLQDIAKSRDTYSNMVKSLTNDITALKNQDESLRNTTDPRLKDIHASVIKSLYEKNTTLHKFHKLLEHSVAAYNATFYRIQKLDDAKVDLKNESKRINQQSNNLEDGESINIPSLNILGFSNNVYSNHSYSNNVYSQQTEQEYLQDLLNNIRPDEEFQDESDCTPTDLSIKLLKHQQMGLSWLLRMEDSKSKGGILADDMGLGKTIQAIALMMANKSNDPYVRTTLIIAPVSLLRQWAAEIDSKVKPTCKMRVAIFHGQEKKRLSTYMQMRKYDVIMTSYGTLSSEWKKHYKEALKESVVKRLDNVLPDLGSGGRSYNSPFFSEDANFYRIILDEAQNIKNKLSIASKATACLKGTYRFCLSGTPIQNNIEELFPIIRFLKIKPYNNEYKFRTDIALPLKSKGSLYDSKDREGSMRKLRAILKAILLRRSKDSIIDGKPILTLPQKHIIKDNVQMDEEEKEYYSSLEAGIQKKAKRLLAEKKQGIASNILTLLLRLRQACCHNYLVELGQLKQQEAEKYNAYNPRDSSIIYRRIKSLDNSIIESLKNRNSLSSLVENDVFSCPLCFDVSSYDSVVLFSLCGHMVCKYCVDSFFSNNEIGDNLDEDRLAPCFECKKIVKESELIECSYYFKVIDENFSEPEFSNYYNKLHAPQGRKSNGSLIQDLIKVNNGFSASAKMLKCVELLKVIFSDFPNEKVIVFSQFTSLFDLMKLVLDENEIQFLRYDGSMSIDHKNATIKSFYQDDSKKVLLLSLRAGNVGLTLTCASHVIIMDPFWNPYVEEQAMDRAYRIGQQREVYVHRILIEGTVESRIMELQEMKKEMVDSALDENSMKSVSKLGQRELGFLFGLNGLR